MSIENVRKAPATAKLTRRKNLETRLLQAQQMESIGLMAGSIAHDVNNILVVIVGFMSIHASKMGEEDPLRTNLHHIIGAADRASKLTRSLLNFTQKLYVVRQPIEFHEILRNVRSFLTMALGEDIRLEMICRTEGLQVAADGAQLEQVVINLAINARHAMPEGGVLTIVAEAILIDHEFICLHGFGKPGNYALISVTDDGVGMDRDTAGRIFEPFFTTRMSQQGTGLGLSIVYRIVREHDGFIEVSSEPRKGTTFRIYLPLAGAERPQGEAA